MASASFSALKLAAQRLVSQNKRRYQDGSFDLDLTYITDDIIAMGFPAGDASSGLMGRVEGLYRNNVQDVLAFLESRHKGCYKVYNLCSERGYDAELFDGVVASFPFDDHNCPPLRLLPTFCSSAKAWLSQGIDNVVVVHCKAGKSRTGLMVCCLLLHLGYYSTAKDVMQHYNRKRTRDGKGLTLSSQQRYVRYYERIINEGGALREDVQRVVYRIRLFNWKPDMQYPKVYFYNHEGLLLKVKQTLLQPEGRTGVGWRRLTRSCLELILPKVVVEGDFKLCIKTGVGKPFYMWAHTAYMRSSVRLPGVEFDHFRDHKRILPGFFIEMTIPSVEEMADGVDFAAGRAEDGEPGPATAAADVAGCSPSIGRKASIDSYATLSPTPSKIVGRTDSTGANDIDEDTCSYSLATPSLLTGIINVHEDYVPTRDVSSTQGEEEEESREPDELPTNEADAEEEDNGEHCASSSGGEDERVSDDDRLYGKLTCTDLKAALDACLDDDQLSADGDANDPA